jgi:Ku70/Ku80 beta-barrel domain
MAPRAYWKGYLRLSLVSCPIALFPATSEREKVHFHQINSKTGNRIRYHEVDEGTGKEAPAEQIANTYGIGKGQHIEITDEELESAQENTNLAGSDVSLSWTWRGYLGAWERDGNEQSLCGPNQDSAALEVVHGYYAAGLGVAQGIDGDRTIHRVRQEQSLGSPDQHPTA